jgi:phosphate starvation-inducible PhoH-like protein
LGTITEKSVRFDSVEQAMSLFGNYDEHISIIEEAIDVKIITRDDEIRIVGEEEKVNSAKAVVERLGEITSQGDEITKQNVLYLSRLANEKHFGKIKDYLADYIGFNAKGKQIKPKTYGQKLYVESIKQNDIVFGIGPAGTGKTFLAVAMAVTSFKNKEVNRIILTRPAVEAGEKLGFLPGDLQNKVDPYLRPLYDALYEMLGFETYQKYIERGLIEIVPLAYMRGRTLNDSFIILDEAQNTTPEQMKMFLTRIGFGSKAIITGDITQIDLPHDKKSGLKEVTKIIRDIKGINFVYLTEKDVVRHELVQKIIRAYEEYETKNKK